MSEATAMPEVSSAGVRTPLSQVLVGSRRPCPVCGQALTGNQTTACSAACRRERSRRREAEANQARDRGAIARVEAMIRTLDKACS